MMYNVTTYGKNLWSFKQLRRMKSLKIFFSALIIVGVFSASSRADVVLNYTDGSPARGWQLPHPQGVTHMAMFFTNQTAVACTLKTVHAGLLDDPDFFNDTTGDLFFTIYKADAAGFPDPDSLLHFESVPNAVFVGGFNQPINVVSLDISSLGLTFPTGGQWVVAVTTDQKSVSAGDTLIFASDQGTKPSLRWFEFTPSAGWQLANCCHGGIDVNMHIYSTISTPSVNQPPVLKATPDLSINESDSLNFIVSATDADSNSITLSMSSVNLPATATFFDSGNGAGAFSWLTDYFDVGIYTVYFKAEDGNGGTDEDTVEITVNNVPQPPIIFPIGDQIVDENQFLEFFVYTSDSDDDLVQLQIVNTNLPPEASFLLLEPGSGKLNWQTDFGDAGVYFVVFGASDGVNLTTDSISITVQNVLCADLAIGDFSLSGPIKVSINKPMGHRLTASAQNIGDEKSAAVSVGFFISADTTIAPPDSLLAGGREQLDSFPPGDSAAISIADEMTITHVPAGFIPSTAYLGIYLDEFDSLAECSEQNNIAWREVFLVDNIEPVLDAIGNKEVNEGELLSFLVTASDIDRDPLSLFAYTEDILEGFIFVDNGNGTGTFSWTPTFDNAGVYVFTFDVSDGQIPGFDSEDITIIVNNVNQPPVLEPIGDTTINENQNLSFRVFATDADLTTPTLTTSILPTGATFVDSGNGSGGFDWTPNSTQSGIYEVIFRASDGSLVDSEVVRITVGNVNQSPVFEIIDDQFVNENELLMFNVYAFDPDFDAIALSLVSNNLPFIAIFVDSGNGVGTFFWQTTYNDNGTYLAIFAAADGQGGMAEDSVSITVINVNRPPVLNPIGDKGVNEGDTLTFVVTASDADGDSLYFNMFSEFLPEVAGFTDNGDGTGTFLWVPSFTDSGTYDANFIVYDHPFGSEDSEPISIIVNNVNRVPEIDSLQDTLVFNEGEYIAFRVSATDPDDDCFELSMVSPNLPPEALFDYVFDCVDYGDFAWTPGCDDAGSYTAIFIAGDGNGGIDADTVLITVNNINAAPVFDEIFEHFVNENVDLVFQVSATDCDGTNPVISALSLPQGATFSPNGNGIGTFAWKPDCNQSGPYVASFLAVDDSTAADTQIVSIIVEEVCNADLTVVNTPCLDCVSPQNYTDILVSDDQFSIEFNIQIFAPSIAGNISISSARGSLLNYFYDPYSKTIDITPEFGDFAPIDTINIVLTQGIRDLADSSLDSTYNLTYLTGPVVYPGDCNNDGTVNEIDVLSIGLYWSEFGPEREFGSEQDPLEFYDQPAHFQTPGKIWEPLNGVYADVDGSGVVDADDLCGIAINFAKFIDKAGALPRVASTTPPGVALKQVGSKVLEQMRDALIECPDSAPKAKMLEAINNALSESVVILPTEIELHQNYPNPFNPSTAIEFFLPKAEYTVLEVYNMLGQRVVTLLDQKVESGYKTVYWNGTDYSGHQVASGIYFYKLNTETKEIIKRMLLVK